MRTKLILSCLALPLLLATLAIPGTADDKHADWDFKWSMKVDNGDLVIEETYTPSRGPREIRSIQYVVSTVCHTGASGQWVKEGAIATDARGSGKSSLSLKSLYELCNVPKGKNVAIVVALYIGDYPATGEQRFVEQRLIRHTF